jgi:hypothetical protein
MEVIMKKLFVGEIINRQKNNYDGYNLPVGGYQIMMISKGYPGEYIKKDLNLEIAAEQWLEWLNDEEREKRENQNWFYLKFNKETNEIDFLWLPEEILADAFDIN